MSVVRRSGCAVALTAVLLVTAGCGDDDSSRTSTPTTTGTDSSPATSSAPVATGPTLTTRNVRVTLPAGWKVNFQSGTQADSVGPSPGRVLVFVSDISSFGHDFDYALAYELKNQPTLRRQADLTVNGVRGFVLAGKDGPSNEWFFGTVYQGQNISVALSSYQERDFAETIAAVSDSIEFLA